MKAIGIILAGGKSKGLEQLSERRAVAAMPVGGNYRSIDFALSSMANSGIRTVGVLTQHNARSLTEHLNSSKWWNFGRKHGGLFVLSPTMNPSGGGWYRGTADAIYQNMDFLKRYHEEYVIITDSDCIYKADFEKLLRYHIEKKADITVVYKRMPETEDLSRFGMMQLDEDDCLIDFEEKPIKPIGNIISAGIYCIRRDLLMELLEKSVKDDRHDFVVDILYRYRNVKRVMGYELKTYWENIADVQHYYQTNMDFLKPEIRNFFFREEPRILTKAGDQAPAKFNAGSQVHNTMAASGCFINGKVENSVLFKEVFVGKECTISNCVILNNVHIEDNVKLEYCVVESDSRLLSGSVYKGTPDNILVVTEHDHEAFKKYKYKY